MPREQVNYAVVSDFTGVLYHYDPVKGYVPIGSEVKFSAGGSRTLPFLRMQLALMFVLGLLSGIALMIDLALLVKVA